MLVVLHFGCFQQVPHPYYFHSTPSVECLFWQFHIDLLTKNMFNCLTKTFLFIDSFPHQVAVVQSLCTRCLPYWIRFLYSQTHSPFGDHLTFHSFSHLVCGICPLGRPLVPPFATGLSHPQYTLILY